MTAPVVRFVVSLSRLSFPFHPSQPIRRGSSVPNRGPPLIIIAFVVVVGVDTDESALSVFVVVATACFHPNSLFSFDVCRRPGTCE
jgi:hypothetical protein